MFRNIALATAVLACAAGAGKLAAQTAAPAKPSASAQKSPSVAPTPKSDTTHAKWTKADIQEAQTKLAKGGYYKGKPTGEMNSDTRKALKAFEKANNMPATGKLNDSVLAKLKSA